jgi:hypothetical protein
MVRVLLFLCLIIGFFSCKKEHHQADFKGIWVDEKLLYLKSTNTPFLADSSARFPLIMIDQEKADSILFYYDTNKRNVYFSQYAYDSYFIHFDKNNEYFLAYDYDTDEMVFSNLKHYDFHRFKKIKTDLTRKDVLSPNFNIDSLIQTVK